MINFIEYDERIESEQVWMAGFDEAIYDSVFDKGGEHTIRYKFGLEDCGRENESTQYPPYCKDGVDLIVDCFEGGIPDLKKFVRGYDTATFILQKLTQGVVHV